MNPTQTLVAFALLALVVANLFWGPKAAANRSAVNAAFTGTTDPLASATTSAGAPAPPASPGVGASLGPSSSGLAD
jgi:hypothetical protein